MLPVNQYKQTLLDHYELNQNNELVYKQDGYLGRYSKGQLVKQFKANRHGYLGVHIPKARATIPVAHLMLLLNGINIPQGYIVDHIDGNPLNNNISNLRVTTQTYNCRNSGKKVGKTGEKCIVLTNKGKYRVRVNINGTRICLGLFNTLNEAIKARDSKLQERLNNGFTLRHLK